MHIGQALGNSEKGTKMGQDPADLSSRLHIRIILTGNSQPENMRSNRVVLLLVLADCFAKKILNRSTKDLLIARI